MKTSKILIVDDDPIIRELLKEFLLDHVIHEAKDGIEALEKLYKEQPDIVFLDYMIPFLDGAGVLRAIEKSPHTKNVKVALVTAKEDIEPENLKKADILFNKPIDIELILKWVEEVDKQIQSQETQRDDSLNRLHGIIEKGWGREEIWATNDKYCGKLMHFEAGSKFSMHFHYEKDETWFVLSGKFKLRFINTSNAAMIEKDLNTGDVWRNLPLLPHQLECIEAGTIIEVSTPDSIADNYRVFPGDSQSK